MAAAPQEDGKLPQRLVVRRGGRKDGTREEGWGEGRVTQS